MNEHVSAEDLRRFRKHETAGEDVRRIARHIASCGDCQERATPSRAMHTLTHAIVAADSDHPSFEEIASFAEGTARGSAARRTRDHIAVCLTCTREADDLRTFARQHHDAPARGRRRVVMAMAASLIIVVAAASGFVAARVATARHDALLAEVPFPRQVAELRNRPSQLRGTKQAVAFNVVEPRGEIVLTDHPTFRWTAPPGARSSVDVFDAAFRQVAASPPILATSWTTPEPLVRGGKYTWQVTVRTGEGSMTIPAPPAPEALFIVAASPLARDALALERSAARPSFELAAAYARCGDFHDARNELQSLIAAGEHTEAARRLLARIDAASR
jgi:hypothetical protein